MKRDEGKPLGDIPSTQKAGRGIRLLVADNFVHGIGGGKYDQVTDRLIAAHWGIRPPALEADTAIRKLEAPVPNLAVGGAGRFLILHLPSRHQLAVFDVNKADFIKEIAKDGLKYKRFGNLLQLLKEVRASLLKILKERFSIEPTSDENEIAEQTIKATSDFEHQPLKRLRWEDLDLGALGDQPAQTLGQRDAARMDADESDPLEVVRLLDDLVRDARQRPLDRLAVEDDLPRDDVGRAHERTPSEGVPGAPMLMRLLLSGLTGPV